MRDQDGLEMRDGFIGSPVSSQQMEKASDSNLLNLFDVLHDGTGWNHPQDWMRGGSVQAAQEFGELAKKNAGRALQLMERLLPERHERYAASAIESLSNIDSVSGPTLIGVVERLHGRGFRSEVFRTAAAGCLGKRATTIGGLDANSCALLEGWLHDDVGPAEEAEQSSSADRATSILVGDKYTMLPQGNYPVLHALFLGYLGRKPMDADGWLGVLERHLERNEDAKVWRALAQHELMFLMNADQNRASAFLERLLTNNPAVLNSEGAVNLMARAHHWLPASLVESCLTEWESGVWELGPQAAAEVAMVRHAIVSDDQFSKSLVERVLSGENIEAKKVKAMRMGLAFLAAKLWGSPRARRASTAVLLALISETDECVTHAWLSVFNHPDSFLVDEFTDGLLDGLVEQPHMLRRAHSVSLTGVLKRLIPESSEYERVCRIVKIILAQSGTKTGDIRTAWAAAAGDFTDLALTLQYIPETRSCGLEIFESLLDFDAHNITQVLHEIDRQL
jgi:hypothetical protein